MAIAIRAADLGSERGELVRFCHDNLPLRPDEQRFDWLYIANPFGEARTLLAVEELSREIVGIGSAFPRQFWVNGKRQRAWVLGDFCIAERFRTLGPALALQRACIAALPADEFWYDFPSSHMLAVYKRLGVPLFTEQVRYVRYLTIDRKLGRPGRYIGQAVAALDHWRLTRKLQLAVHEGTFGSDFTELDNHPDTHRVIRASRSADYLNWRYRANPAASYTVVTARQGSRLNGYLVVHNSGDEATLCDLLLSNPAVLSRLLAYLIRILVESNVSRLNASLLSHSALRPQFWRAGFIAREAAPVVVHYPGRANVPALQNSRDWLLLHGDRES